MKRFNVLKCLFFVVILYGCKGVEKSDFDERLLIDSSCVIINLDVPSPENIANFFSHQMDISSYMDTFKFVKLELSDESLIGSIRKLEVYENRIYILDDQTYSLFVFDMDGKYLFKINDVGQGPQEYIQLDFFDIDRKKRQIVLTDLMGYWVMRYDMDGKFISRQKIPFWVEGVTPLENGYGLYSNFRNNRDKFSQEYNIFIMDSDMKVQKTYFPYNSSIYENPKIKLGCYGIFYHCRDSCRFYSTVLNTIYDISPQGVSAKYKFIFGSHTFEYSKLFDKSGLDEYVSSKNYYELGCIAENDSMLNFAFSTQLFPFYILGFYSKASGNTIYSPNFLIGKTEYFAPCPTAAFDSWLITKLTTEELIYWNESKNIKDMNDTWVRATKKIADEIAVDDNPVLVFYKLKSF